MAREPLLREIVEEVLGEDYARKVWKRIDIIGDIAVIRKPFDMEVSVFKKVGDALLRRIPYVRSVWLSVGSVEGIYRLRDLVHLAGERRTETLYIEHGCKFKLDITKVYVSLRLSYEHVRIASLIRDGERVLNMYAGAGFFSIHAACRKRLEAAYSIDINPYAYHYMVLNTRLNGVEDRVVPIYGEAYATTMKLFRHSVDRVLMPLPEKALEHLPAAVAALENGGWIHVYLHVGARRQGEAIEQAKRLVLSRIAGYAESVEVRGSRVVRTVGPREYQVVVDVFVEPRRSGLET